MPNRPIAERWVARIRSLRAEGLSARAIASKLESEGEDSPSERTVGRYMEDFGKRPEEEQRRYREFYWPDSLQSGSLPWEAAPAALEMLSHFQGRPRPLLGAVEWFWRVTQAAPDAPYKEREAAALQLAGVMAGSPELNRPAVEGVERWLIEHLSKGHTPGEKARGRIFVNRVKLQGSTTAEGRLAVIEALAGFPLDDETKRTIDETFTKWRAENDGAE
jgi:hypothetical protein